MPIWKQSNLHSQYAMVLLIDGIVGRMLTDEQNQTMLRCGESAQVQLPADSGAASDLKIVPLPMVVGQRRFARANQAADTDGSTNVSATTDGDDSFGTLTAEGIGVVWIVAIAVATRGFRRPPGG